jgi:superfamily II DNA/RNA helicase
MPPRIRKLAQELLNNPAEVKIAPSRPVEKIAQSAIMCNDTQKEGILLRLLKERHGSKVIVFASSKLGVRDLTRYLRRNGIKAAEIHSDLDQKERDDTIHEFRAERINVLVATDLLARGIDIDDISMVVNYDVPREPEDYVHRVGRTGRANAEGTAVTLVSPRDRRAFSRVESTLKIKIPIEDTMAGSAPGRADRPASTHSNNRRNRHNNNNNNNNHNGSQPGNSAETSAEQRKPRKRRYFHRKKSGGNSAPTA